jgi:hypothetical protein
MVPLMFEKKDMQSEKAVKLVERLKKLNIIPKESVVELLFGSTLLWSVNPCLICTENEIILFDNLKKGLVPKKERYSYSTITGCVKETKILSKIYLYLGGAEKIQLDYELHFDWAEAFTTFVSAKIRK